jgi:hypothetical protein
MDRLISSPVSQTRPSVWFFCGVGNPGRPRTRTRVFEAPQPRELKNQIACMHRNRRPCPLAHLSHIFFPLHFSFSRKSLNLASSLNNHTMLKEQFNRVIEIYQSLDGIEQAAFSFWSLCVAAFYGTLVYILYLIGKEGIEKLRRSRS